MGREDQGVARSRERYGVIPRTLCFITFGDNLLLLRGGPGKRLWPNLYNGVGGHVEPGEDIYAANLREVKEETGLDVGEVRLRGIVHADAGDPVSGILFFVFAAVAASQNVTPSSEGTLEWLPTANLPVAAMVEDLPVLIPKVLAMGPVDPPFFAAYRYDAEDRLSITFAPAPSEG
jgi:8-oxo-dGTP diphosphatase